MTDSTIRALERRLINEQDFSLVPFLATLYARTNRDESITLWLAIKRVILGSVDAVTTLDNLPPMSTSHSLHVTKEGALAWIGETLRTLATQGRFSGDGVAILRALDDPAWGPSHAFALYQHRLHEWGGEECGNCYLSFKEVTLKP